MDTFIYRCIVLTCLVSASAVSSAAQTADSNVAVRIVSDESDAVLALIGRKLAHEAISEKDWHGLFTSEGYVRLKKREASFHRDFTDEQFKSFVLSDSLSSRSGPLGTTLGRWKLINVAGAARRALAYLPPGSRIKATIYPVIKPRTNSFVFETGTDPAIFLYLDPAVGADKFENTLTHELHHIGYASSCGKLADRIEADSTLPKSTRTALGWLGAFGEGFAMLAAAGGPDVHPHAVSPRQDRERWDADMKNFNGDLKTVERFFLGILDDKLTAGETDSTASSFFGIQGPWYTVGWKMAATIETAFGRGKLIECMCDHRLLLATYNEAALEHNRHGGDSLALWSPPLIDRLAR